MAIRNKSDKDFDFDMSDKSRKIKVGEDITLTAKNYMRLLYYATARMDDHDDIRCINNLRYEAYDAIVGGYETKDEIEVRERQRRNAIEAGRAHELPTVKLTTVMERLEDVKTAVMGILFPSHEFYRTSARSPDDMNKAHALSRILNQEAKVFKHYSEISKIVMRTLKYGWSGGFVEWNEAYGRTFANLDNIPGTSLDKENGQVTFVGNEITAFDNKNTGWDMSVPIEKVAREGEYVWTVTRENLHSLRKRALIDETIYGPEELKNTLKNLISDTSKLRKSSLLKEQFDMYAEMPQLVALGTTCRYKEQCAYVYNGTTHTLPDPKLSNGGIDWGAFENRTNASTAAFGTAEVSSIWIKLNPKDFGIGKENTIKTYYIEIVNDAYIIFMAEIGSGNAPLPLFLGSLGDNTAVIERSRGELVLPYQTIAERMLDQHFKAVTKSLGGGWTFIRKGMVTVSKVANSLTGVHEVRSSNHDRSLANDIHQVGNTPITENPMREVAMLNQLARDSNPTASGKVMTDLDRATKHQSETARYENSRVMNDMAILFDDRLFYDMRLTLGENEFVNREKFTAGLKDRDGNLIEYSVDDMRGVSLAISNGIMSIDRFAVMSHLETLINFAIQSGERNEFDMVRLLNYYADKAGIETDLSHFVQGNPLQRVSEELQQALTPLMENGQLEPLLLQMIQQLAAAEQQGGQPTNG